MLAKFFSVRNGWPSKGARILGADIILETEGLSKAFHGFKAVDGVSLQIRRGTIHSIIGPNGAGKTTCFNLLSKFHQPTQGRITFAGQDITNLSPADVARLGLVRSFQISAVFPHFTALENVRIALQRRRGASLDFWRSKRVLEEYEAEALAILREVELEEYANHLAVELAYGRKRALEFATTMALRPQVVLLDEPMSGLGLEDIDRIADLIKAASRHCTIVLVEHNLGVVARLSDVITVMARGTVLVEGSYETISNDPRVREAYLGE